MFQLMCVIFKKANQNFASGKMDLSENKKISKISDEEFKNDLISQKEKQHFSIFMKSNFEKTRWNFIQNLRNKEKIQTIIKSLLNSFNKFLIYKFSNLGDLIGLQQTNIPPKPAPRKCFKFRYITSTEISVLTYSLLTSKPLGPSKYQLDHKKMLKQRWRNHYVISLISSPQ